jgi:DNA-directed RNA polymerase specialized sigma24 family protein
VKRWLAVVAGGFGLAAYFRRRRRRRTDGLEADPADELRAKLAQAREGDAEPEPAPPPEPEPGDTDDVSARRREVHEQARKAIDDLG